MIIYLLNVVMQLNNSLSSIYCISKYFVLSAAEGFNHYTLSERWSHWAQQSGQGCRRRTLFSFEMYSPRHSTDQCCTRHTLQTLASEYHIYCLVCAHAASQAITQWANQHLCNYFIAKSRGMRTARLCRSSRQRTVLWGLYPSQINLCHQQIT